MTTPTSAQLQKRYVVCHQLSNTVFQPIHIVRLDERTGNIFILAGREEEIEILPNGDLTP